ncbi:TRAP transporter small permease [Pseudooceanicola sp. CBS1P-1]|uniref:TRAP transporter small permease protein n=1 Tax=Pseudooceanicola albus TaxID=2692189 RepID=A0A6L7G788_9RHOB|nr:MULTISPECIES: TRAP transporter small permease [Pseudooceanicola]MBT9386177.1 TRAP transporter small permease [Pseudooceanicola endophyticus]MXN19408.1 TRAP transporter small permease subunit [Pseudooceanicola albus]
MPLIRFVDRLSYALALLSGIALCSVALLIVAEILLRKFAGISLHFLWEYGVFVHMTAVFLGAGWTLRTGGHIRVTLLRGLSPRLFELWATLLGLVISSMVSNALVQMAWGYIKSGRTTGTTTNTPLAIPATIMAFGAVLLTVQIALRLLSIALGRDPELATTGEDTPAPIMD